MDRGLYNHILELLHQEVKPALGCTEPVCVAIAIARAASLFEGRPLEVKVKVSSNILKNAMGVGIPGTGLIGLPIASALAVVCGNADYGLEVLKDVNAAAVEEAKAYVDSGAVSISLADNDRLLYVEAECIVAGGDGSRCIIADSHDRIVFVSRDDEVLCDCCDPAPDAGDGSRKSSDGLSLEQIYEFACTASLEDLGLMREEIRMNTALSEAGLNRRYGLMVGRTIADRAKSDVFGDGLMTRCMAMTAAASDARMAGCVLPAMSNSGSGNQGITVSMPVIAAAKALGSDEESLIRALTLSNLVAIHIKSYLGKLSALCGCVVASTGSSCGIVMLGGGGLKEIGYAVKNMIGNITGMVCDGAKEGCAMKVASGVSCSVQSAMLAMKGICVPPTDGIIDKDVEKTIANLGRIGSMGMKQTDAMILDIMVCK